ncbi:MAG: T9SS type A sorting domain-containing protein [Bacteroidia bacterium]
MKKIYSLLIPAFLSVPLAKAQSYTQGDLTVNVIPNSSHDSTACQSTCFFMYNIQKNNSFLNDTVFIKDWGGYILYSFVNTAGNSSWNDFAMIPQLFGVLPDYNLAQPGNMANFMMPLTKAISGTDTIYNIQNYYGTVVNDPCSYSPVNGQVYVDQNSDCIFNVGDIPLQGLYISSWENLSSPSINWATWGASSNSTGNYGMMVQQSWMTSYSVGLPPQYQFIFPSTACSPASYNFTALPQANVDFSLQCGSVIDVQTWAGSMGFARPGIPFILNPSVNNSGCDSASGVLKLVLDPRVIYNPGLSSNPATSTSGDTLFWNYTNLTNLSNGAYWNSFSSGVYLTPDSTVNTGDVLCFQTFATIASNDLNPANNSASVCIPVVNSHDPNFKEVTPVGVGSPGYIADITPNLTYTIHFQNTGSAAAYNIYITDTLSANVDASSLQIIESSHAMMPIWNAPGVVRFNFNSIFLPDSASNEPASHGFVTFKVNLLPSLPAATEIKNTAYIYFDSNPAIITNTALNTIAFPIGIKETEGNRISLQPNPAISEINVSSATAFEKVEIYSIAGELLSSERFAPTSSFKVDIKNLPAGIYFIRTDRSGMMKFVVLR